MAVRVLSEGCTFIGSLGGKHQNSGLLLSSGTSSIQATTATADKNWLQFYLKSTATSGDSRGLYLRLYIAGAGGSGEAARIYTTVHNVAAGSSVHGAHISLSFGTSGSVTGLGVAMRATLHVPNAAVTTGTRAAIQAEAYMDGTSSDVTSIVNSFALFRVSIAGGDATAQSKVKTFMILDTPAQGDGAFINSNATVIGYSVRAALKVVHSAKTFYIPLLAAS